MPHGGCRAHVEAVGHSVAGAAGHGCARAGVQLQLPQKPAQPSRPQPWPRSPTSRTRLSRLQGTDSPAASAGHRSAAGPACPGTGPSGEGESSVNTCGPRAPRSPEHHGRCPQGHVCGHSARRGPRALGAVQGHPRSSRVNKRRRLQVGPWRRTAPSWSPGLRVPGWPCSPYGLVLPRLLAQRLPALLSLHADLLALQLLHGGFVLLRTHSAEAQTPSLLPDWQLGLPPLPPPPCWTPCARSGQVWAQVLLREPTPLLGTPSATAGRAAPAHHSP